MKERNNLTGFLNETIYHWVGKNFGKSEADEPSWNIEELSSYLAKKLKKEYKINGDIDDYELTILYRTDTEVDIDSVAKKVEEFGGIFYKSTDEGKKKLAYTINGEKFAEYVYCDLGLPNGVAPKLSSWLNIRDEVLRYLLVKCR